MDYLGDKLNSVTGNALTGINKLKRNRDNKQKSNEPDQPAQEQQQQQVGDGDETQAKPSFNQLYGFKSTTSRTYGLSSPVPAGIPFGGDSSFTYQHEQQNQPQPPPIGFRTDLIVSSSAASSKQRSGAASGAADQPDKTDRWQHQPEGGQEGRGSEQSLYDGDAWGRVWFQRVMVLSFIRLMVFTRKVYEDFQATKTYSISGHSGHFLFAVATLFLPTIIFTIYRVCRYLQFALPPVRELTVYPGSDTKKERSKRQAGGKQSTNRTNESSRSGEGRALMGSTSGTASPRPHLDDEGLVTARQTPTNLDEFHDSRSQQEQAISVDGTSSLAPSTAIVKDSPPQHSGRAGQSASKETIDNETAATISNIQEKEMTKVVIGASEQLLHGALFIFWQLKRQVDVMGYLVERSCLWRKPREQEKEELGRLRTGSDGLEWFQDFYAAFLAILVQVYTLGIHWASNSDEKAQHRSGLTSAASGISGAATSDSEISISQSARALIDTVALAGAKPAEGKDLLIMSELIVSSAVVFSLLIAVRRRDDGPMTLGLSMLGWGSIFASRIIIIGLSFVHIGWKIMLPLVLLHILGITGWIYKIAIDSHNGMKDESEESKWDPELAVEEGEQTQIELEPSGASGTTSKQEPEQVSPKVTSQWSCAEHIVLMAQIFTLFAVPSLFYWPIMFNLKLHCRPFKYLVLVLSENFILIPAIWFTISSSATPGQWTLLCAVGGFSIVGFIFVSLYVSCKPSLTDYFARADELFNEAEKSGIYYEFCSRVFKMPDLSKQVFRRLMNQTEQVEEIEVEARE